VNGPQTLASVGRVDQTLTLLNNGMVLVEGGIATNVTVTNSAKLYDPTSDKLLSRLALVDETSCVQARKTLASARLTP
jgi:hypothetical protein